MTFEEADQLLDEVTSFLVSCGTFYRVTGKLEATVLECLALGHYIIHRDETGEITHFLCYRMIDLTMFVLEHGNKDGRRGMTRMIRELRLQEPQTVGTAWNHKGLGIVAFPNQKSQKGVQRG